MFIEFPPLAEFEDVSGEVRSIRGCSLLGREEFFQRLSQVQERLKLARPEEGWQEFYQRDRRFAWLIKRCLIVNSIDPEWVNLDMVERLLFHRSDPELGSLPGWLVELNQVKGGEAGCKAKGLSVEELIAIVSLQTSSVSEALQLAQSMPADRLMEIISARADLQQPPEKRRRSRQQAKQKLMAQFDRLMEAQGWQETN